MKNTFRTYMEETYSHNEMADMANHGSNTGHHGLIWTSDMVKLYDKHCEALHSILAEYQDAVGEWPEFVNKELGDSDQFKGAVVYFAAEWVANELTQGEYIDEVDA